MFKLTSQPALFIILLAILGGLSYGGYRFYQSKPTSPQPAISSTEPTPAEETKPITQPTSDPDWNLYTNKKYGFSVEYPSRWEIEEEQLSTGTGSKEIARDRVDFRSKGFGYINIYINEDPSLDLTGWVKANEFIVKLSSAANVPDMPNAVVAGTPAFVVFSPSDYQVPDAVSSVLRKGRNFISIGHARIGEYVGSPLLWDIYEHFLRTFEFEGAKDTPDELPKFPMGA